MEDEHPSLWCVCNELHFWLYLVRGKKSKHIKNNFISIFNIRRKNSRVEHTFDINDNKVNTCQQQRVKANNKMINYKGNTRFVGKRENVLKRHREGPDAALFQVNRHFFPFTKLAKVSLISYIHSCFTWVSSNRFGKSVYHQVYCNSLIFSFHVLDSFLN